jgi:hypothetical protein
VCGAARPGTEFALRFTIAHLLHREVLMLLIILRHFALIVTEDSVMTWSNKITVVETAVGTALQTAKAN